MTQLERLIARVVQLVEDNPATMVLLSIAVNGKGEPICWQVMPNKAEGLQEAKPDIPLSGIKKSGNIKVTT